MIPMSVTSFAIGDGLSPPPFTLPPTKKGRASPYPYSNALDLVIEQVWRRPSEPVLSTANGSAFSW